jgi:hypothetical protein
LADKDNGGEHTRKGATDPGQDSARVRGTGVRHRTLALTLPGAAIPCHGDVMPSGEMV